MTSSDEPPPGTDGVPASRMTGAPASAELLQVVLDVLPAERDAEPMWSVRVRGVWPGGVTVPVPAPGGALRNAVRVFPGQRMDVRAFLLPRLTGPGRTARRGDGEQRQPIIPEPVNEDRADSLMGYVEGHWDYPARCADVELALTDARERVEEWDREADPHGWWHERPHWIARWKP